jgi:ferredoxin
MCDGLGACIGHCPEGAITIEEREAEPYNEIKVMEQMMKKGKNTLIAHLGHLKEHGEKDFLRQGVQYMLEHQDELDFDPDEVLEAVHDMPHGAKRGTGEEEKRGTGDEEKREHGHGHDHGHDHGHHHHHHEEGAGCGCQGSQTRTFGAPAAASVAFTGGSTPSALTHWPVQMHLLNPRAGHFQGSNLLLAADCTAFSLGNFHGGYLKGKTLAIACPKLDSNREVYVEKLRVLIQESAIDTLTVMVMEVPCCNGLLQIAEMALSQCERTVPVKVIVVSVDGKIKLEKWHRV